MGRLFADIISKFIVSQTVPKSSRIGLINFNAEQVTVVGDLTKYNGGVEAAMAVLSMQYLGGVNGNLQR
jgi:hypothetical protein